VVSSTFVIDVQSKLEPDSAERSEAYLREILLILNQSISPNEDPAAPPAQLKAVDNFLDACMSFNMKKPNRSSQMISNLSRSPSAPTSRNRQRKVTAGCGERRFPRGAKLECVSNTGESLSGLD